ncbi:sulfur globule protein CV3 [Manduca sexta]|uniref:sulfur globule protein CV3 n=1 Tax=Manduca sexta TaxID=7130 RepID=UPI00188E9DF6|nr:sulfur globule protein CV3 [Manduca sexta]
MASKFVLAICLMVAVASAVPQPGRAWGGAGWGGAGWGGVGGVNPWIPPWIVSSPWYPQWSPCTTIGSACVDCNTKLVCTKVGGLVRACSDPTLPYCNLGECSATPSAECAPEPVPAAV